MKAIIDREAFAAAYMLAFSVRPTRTPKPVLSHILFVADPEQGSELIATDLEIGIRARVLGVKVDEPGIVLLPGDDMRGVLRTSQADELSLETVDDNLNVRGKGTKYRFPTENAEHYPVPAKFAAPSFYSIEAAALKRLIRRTEHATDVDSTRYALGGVRFEFAGDGMIKAVGTDGRCLAVQEEPIEDAGVEAPQEMPIVPLKACKVIEKLLGDDDPPVHLAVDPGRALFVRAERATLWTRLVEGRYPRYGDVFPKSDATRCELTAGELLAAIEQASITTSEESRGVDFRFTSGALMLHSTAAERGEGDIELACAWPGGPFAVTMDPGFFVSCLKTLEAGQAVTIELFDPKAPVVLRTSDGLTFVVMPLTRE